MIFFYWNNVSEEVLWFICIHEFVCVCLFVSKHCMKINNKSKICSLLPLLFRFLLTPQIALFLGPYFSSKSCPWKIISMCVCVCVCLCVVLYSLAYNSLCLCAL